MPSSTYPDESLIKLGYKLRKNFGSINRFIHPTSADFEKQAVLGQSDFFESWANYVDLWATEESFRRSKVCLHRSSPDNIRDAKYLLHALNDVLITALTALDERDNPKGKKQCSEISMPHVLTALWDIEPNVTALQLFAARL